MGLGTAIKIRLRRENMQDAHGVICSIRIFSVLCSLYIKKDCCYCIKILHAVHGLFVKAMRRKDTKRHDVGCCVSER